MVATLYEWSNEVVWRRNLYLGLASLFAISTVTFGGLFGGYYAAWKHSSDSADEYDRCLAETFAAIEFAFDESFDIEAEFHFYFGSLYYNPSADPSKYITDDVTCRRIFANTLPKTQLRIVNNPENERRLEAASTQDLEAEGRTLVCKTSDGNPCGSSKRRKTK